MNHSHDARRRKTQPRVVALACSVDSTSARLRTFALAAAGIVATVAYLLLVH